jgi:hypothetical protein
MTHFIGIHMRDKILLVLVVGAMSIAMNVMAEVSPASKEMTSTLQRLHLLEQAFYPAEPSMVAKFYAKAVMERNGALQFMVLSPELQQKFRPTLESSKWVTGASSPRVISYDAVNIERSAKLWKFVLHFNLEYAGGRLYSCANHVEIGQIVNPELVKSPLWAVTAVEFFDPTQACQSTEQ